MDNFGDIATIMRKLVKKNDYETNPASESVESLAKKIKDDYTDYYFIVLEDRNIGAISVVRLSAK